MNSTDEESELVLISYSDSPNNASAPVLANNPRATRARARRTTESVLIQDLGRALPISQRTLRSLDKISILRLAVTELKLRQFFVAGARKADNGLPADYAMEELIAGGFLIVISAGGDVVYVSEAISESLGLNSWEVMGKNIYDYALSEDHPDLDQLLAVDYYGNGTTSDFPSIRTGLARLKSTLRPPHNPVYFRQSSNKVIYFTGKMYLKPVTGGGDPAYEWPCFIGVGHTIPHPADNNYPWPTLGSQSFISICSMKNMGFVQVDSGFEHLMGYTSRELSNMKGFDVIHAQDAMAMIPMFKALFSKGQTQFEPHRLLVKGGGWIWMTANASTVYKNSYRANTQSHSKSSHCVCRMSALSGVETKEILSHAQLHEGSSHSSGSDSEGYPSPAPTYPLPASPEKSANLFEELLHSGPSVTESSPDLGIDWQDSIGEFGELVSYPPVDKAQVLFPSAPVKEEAFDPYNDLSALTGEVDFTTLPAFTRALDAFFMQEPVAPDYSPSLSEGEQGGYSSKGSGVALGQARSWTVTESLLDPVVGQDSNSGPQSQIQMQTQHIKKMKGDEWQ